jgi:hypothetical protein
MHILEPCFVCMLAVCCNTELRDNEAQESEVAPAGLTSVQIKLLSMSCSLLGSCKQTHILSLAGSSTFSNVVLCVCLLRTAIQS